MSRLRVALVTPHYPPFIGGVEVHVQQLAEGLASRGHMVDVLTQADPGQPATMEKLAGVTVRRWPILFPSRHYTISTALYWQLRRRRQVYDLVHAHAYHSLPSLAAALGGCRPLVFTPHYHGTGHSTVRRLLHPPYRQLGRRTFDASSRVICVSEPERELVLRDFPHIAPKLVTIPNGVELDRLRGAPRLQLPGPTALVAGRIESYKRIELVLQAVSLLPERWQLAVTGAGPGRERLERLVRELRLQGRVRLLGNLPTGELHSWLRSATVLVSMSSNEAMPVVVVEAMGAGTPAVLSPIPAHRALAERWPGAVLLVSDPADSRELAAAIERTEGRSRLSLQVPSWDEVVEETLAVYRQVVC